jgi:Kef-type K+ transport system membrane component KefB
MLITLLMIGMRLLAGFYLKHLYGARNALLAALALSMPLTLLIAVATIGYTASIIDIIIYYQLILASLFEVIISMLAIKLIRKGKGTQIEEDVTP